MIKSFGRLLWHLRENGLSGTHDVVRKTLAAAIRQYLNRRWDRRHHVDTSDLVQLESLTCAGDKTSGIWYEPTPLRTLQQMSAHLPVDLSDFTFVDFGSGKGRTVLHASRLNFKRIVGVEFAKELDAIARRNVRSFHCPEQRCSDVRVQCIDAAEFPIPEGPCVFYFFHPFRSEVMARVIRRMEDSFRQAPRAFIILYYHPRVAELFDGVGFLRKRTEETMPFDWTAEPCVYRRRLAIYETAGPRCKHDILCNMRSGLHCLIPISGLRPATCPLTATA